MHAYSSQYIYISHARVMHVDYSAWLPDYSGTVQKQGMLKFMHEAADVATCQKELRVMLESARLCKQMELDDMTYRAPQTRDSR